MITRRPRSAIGRTPRFRAAFYAYQTPRVGRGDYESSALSILVAADRAKGVPMSRVRHLLPEPDERAVVMREPCRGNQSDDRDTSQLGEDLGDEDRWVRALAIPFTHSSLVCGVLSPAELRGASAVGRLALFGA
jgi:hypothetical protein